jgi:hypothetical protein
MTSRNGEFGAGSGDKPIFHGTSKELNPGDIIYPSTHPNHPDSKQSIEWRDEEVEDGEKEGMEPEDIYRAISRHWDSAWANSSLDNAKGYATRQGFVSTPHTYQVVHLDPSECDGCAFYSKSDTADHTDPKGFRVIREV